MLAVILRKVSLPHFWNGRLCVFGMWTLGSFSWSWHRRGKKPWNTTDFDRHCFWGLLFYRFAKPLPILADLFGQFLADLPILPIFRFQFILPHFWKPNSQNFSSIFFASPSRPAGLRLGGQGLWRNLGRRSWGIHLHPEDVSFWCKLVRKVKKKSGKQTHHVPPKQGTMKGKELNHLAY